MVQRQKQCSSERNKNCPPFPSTPLNVISQSRSLTVHSLGALLDSTLSVQNFIDQTSKSCYYQLLRFSSVRKYLSTDATVELVTSLILSPSDYWNSLLSDNPATSNHNLQRIQNCAACLVVKKQQQQQQQKTHT